MTRFDIEVIRATWLPFLGATGVFACLGGPLSTLVELPPEAPLTLTLLNVLGVATLLVVGQVLPLLLAIAVWVGITRMRLEGDWLGWQSLGISPRRILLPVAGIAVVGGLCYGSWLSWLQPTLLSWSHTRMASVARKLVYRQLAAGEVVGAGQVWRLFPPGDGQPFAAAEYLPTGGVRWWTSQSLTLSTEGVLYLGEGQAPPGQGGPFTDGTLTFRRAEIPLTGLVSTRLPAALTSTELRHRISTMVGQGKIAALEKLNLYQRFILPWFCIPLLLGVAMGVVQTPSVGRSFLILVGLVSLTLLGLRLAEVACSGGWLSPLGAAFLPVCLLIIPLPRLGTHRWEWR